MIDRASYTAEGAAAELKWLLNAPSYTKQAAEIGRQIRAENGVRTACDYIEACLK